MGIIEYLKGKYRIRTEKACISADKVKEYLQSSKSVDPANYDKKVVLNQSTGQTISDGARAMSKDGFKLATEESTTLEMETEHVEAIPGPAFEISKEAYERMLEDEKLTQKREKSPNQQKFEASITDETKGDFMDSIKKGSILLVEKHPDIVRNVVRDDAEEEKIEKMLENFEAGLEACKKLNEDLGDRTFDK